MNKVKPTDVYVPAEDSIDNIHSILLWDDKKKRWEDGGGVEKKENMIVLTIQEFDQIINETAGMVIKAIESGEDE